MQRWQSPEGRSLRQKILTMIRNGAGEDFLQWDFEQGKLGFLEDMWDLKGLVLQKEDIEFPKADNFEAIDFSYASLYNCKFKNATFYSSHSSFVRFSNCELVDCVFSLAGFYGSTLDRVKFVNCDFVEHNTLVNCDLRNVQLQSCFPRADYSSTASSMKALS